MESQHSSSSFSSLPEVLDALENLLAAEVARVGDSWINMTRLRELFHAKYGVSLAAAAAAQGYSGNLRSLISQNCRLVIYPTPAPQEFYVALRGTVVPSYEPHALRPVPDYIKRGWRVDGSFIRLLEAEGAVEMPSPQLQRRSDNHPYQPNLPPEIQSVADFEQALVEICKSLTVNQPQSFASIGMLSQKFREHYGRPIRTVRQSVCSDMKLVELLQTIPALNIQAVGNDWQITVAAGAGD